MNVPKHTPLWLALLNMYWLPEATLDRILIADAIDDLRIERFKR